MSTKFQVDWSTFRYQDPRLKIGRFDKEKTQNHAIFLFFIKKRLKIDMWEFDIFDQGTCLILWDFLEFFQTNHWFLINLTLMALLPNREITKSRYLFIFHSQTIKDTHLTIGYVNQGAGLIPWDFFFFWSNRAYYKAVVLYPVRPTFRLNNCLKRIVRNGSDGWSWDMLYISQGV